MNDALAEYPQPGPMGGTLIRRIISLLRFASAMPESGATLHLACSGGADSVALAQIIQKYGRRIAAHDRLRLLHIHHGWRGTESDQDAEWVRELGDAWGIPVQVVRLNPEESQPAAGDSWENAARMARGRIYAAELKKMPGVVFTAHHADDLAETLLWRLFTGTAEVEGAGIAIRYEGMVRPLLQVRRDELRVFLKEEGLSWREDATNHEGRFLRSKMRQNLMPSIDVLFPKAVDHLVELAMKNQPGLQSLPDDGDSRTESLDAFRTMFQAAGLRVRRPHWQTLIEKSQQQDWSGDLNLPGGWILTRDKVSDAPGEESWHLRRSRRNSRFH